METTSEIDGTHRLPIYARSLENELQKVIHDVGKRRIVNEIQPDYAYSYACRFIQRVNKEEEKSEKKNIQERYDKSFRPQPQEGKANLSQACLVHVPKYLLNVSQDQEQKRKECRYASKSM